MNCAEIIEKNGNLKISEKRTISQDYSEIVIDLGELEKWVNILTDYFGPCIKPKGVKPSKEHLKITSNYGGLYINQILFMKKDNNKEEAIAMFWPWQDGQHVTLKIVKFDSK